VDYELGKGNAQNNLGISLDCLHKFEEAEKSCRKGVDILSDVVSKHPNAPRCQKVLGDGHVNLGLSIVHQGRVREAIVEFREAIAVLKKLTAEHLDAPEYRVSYAGAHLALGMALARQHDWESALVVHRKGISIVKEVVGHNPGMANAKNLLWELYYDAACDLSRCASAARRGKRATALADEAMSMLQQAKSAGWNDWSQAATDPDLKPLHSRRDFQSLVFDRMMPSDPFARD
jgi:tetratricopeptide (TPR) repeat protein